MAKITSEEAQKFLKGVIYPIPKADLVEQAELEGAGSEVLDALRTLPYENISSPTEIEEALG